MLVSFLLASSLLPSYALAHSSHSHATTRRSVAFGPALDHSTFRALDPEPDSSALPRDPFEIARRLPGVEGEHWYIRDDVSPVSLSRSQPIGGDRSIAIASFDATSRFCTSVAFVQRWCAALSLKDG